MGHYVPERGDIIWLNFSPQMGHEQAGHRPAFVISSSNYNRKTGLAICCPITNQIKGYPFEVILPEASKVRGTILSDQMKNLDWRVRGAKWIDTMPADITKEVTAKITAIISSH